MAENSRIIVQKYGGSSVADTAKIKQVAGLIARKYHEGVRLCVVVSAMGKTTDQLLKQAYELTTSPSRRELDMLLSCGERASMALLAMALEAIGVPSISFTGSQSGIITTNVHSDARIIAIRPFRVQEELNKGKVVIIAGFQGVSLEHEITTLGRGGSDTTAVAMAAALQAESCEIYSDVKGVYSADPKIVPDSFLLDTVSIEDMANLADAGAKVLNAQAVQFAHQHGITIHARATGDEHPGTRVTSKDESSKPLVAVAHKSKIHGFLLANTKELNDLLNHFASNSVTPQWILNTPDSQLLCCVYPEDAHGLSKAVESFTQQHNLHSLTLGSVSLIGQEAHQPHTLIQALHCLENNRITIKAMHTTPRITTFFVQETDVAQVTKLLHNSFFNLENMCGGTKSQPDLQVL